MTTAGNNAHHFPHPHKRHSLNLIVSYPLTRCRCHWDSFELEARRHFRSVGFSNKVLDYAPAKEDDHEFHIKKEQLLCGDEHSVVARFGQNVGHVMTSVLRGGVGTKLRFGDYKCVKPPEQKHHGSMIL
ncbi:unnamed protein product [Aspergillus oryzae RIB40]|uniref:DNA, SC001 n=1 Tax=Aspergillus oryzae (strain ATCC 42149 / RIB 40) TaxID=510516 RepID=Q2UNU5_ASPOR|nr:unnamed protein product [Aspergillus oryzae RIB40]BAE56770.1 unnamed protein product [Aspergillus oryzae RIB40]